MGYYRRATPALLFLLLLIGTLARIDQRAIAQDETRETTIVLEYTEVEWWLLRWSDNEITCQILVDHEGLPTSTEVYNTCGGTLYDEWRNTSACKQVLKNKDNSSACKGLYLREIATQPKKKEIKIELPLASVGVSLEGCTPAPPANRCETLPALLLTGEEPLPNERITSIEGKYNSLPFACDGSTCKLPLTTTPMDGIKVEFWANSSYGDTSPTFSALVRVVDSGVSQAPGSGGWYVDVLSSQWRGSRLASCSQTWQALPPVGGLNTWLGTPKQISALASERAYYYLAGRLIAQGVVDASACATGGLLANGYADACGLDAARPQLVVWQNQFDARILQVAEEKGVPAQLMKNLFAQESQFWPGIFRVPFEYGLGQITDKGADAILLWNPSFYDQFCPLVLSADRCAEGYLRLNTDAQALLRGALAVKAKTDCKDCEEGVDLSQADFSVSLFADTILANCEQVAQIVFNASGEIAGTVSNYEDLWRFTLANYHAGPGCVSYAIHAAWNDNRVDILWEEVATRFTPACQGVVPYVEKIAR